ncbi:hypothetical protein CKO37_09885 [Rubrivivax gelatinosus]|nr:hypothetical protein [Rubrivivax gelatinosus]
MTTSDVLTSSAGKTRSVLTISGARPSAATKSAVSSSAVMINAEQMKVAQQNDWPTTGASRTRRAAPQMRRQRSVGGTRRPTTTNATETSKPATTRRTRLNATTSIAWTSSVNKAQTRLHARRQRKRCADEGLRADGRLS